VRFGGGGGESGNDGSNGRPSGRCLTRSLKKIFFLDPRVDMGHDHNRGLSCPEQRSKPLP
jgi:hypothetical protein